LLIGGTAPAAIRRTVEHGAGWISGGGGAEQFSGMAKRIRDAWADAGKVGAPRLVALGYYALGDGAVEAARSYLTDYYEFLGPIADRIADGALTDPEMVRTAVDRFAAAGCDELILIPCAADPAQVGLLAEAVA
jgi:alkanesulfonate monooxygenase SsuD/methylene tetrahydromethanopterin reductase-like flavin-dependent oxidoreductase (luciferase family)